MERFGCFASAGSGILSRDRYSKWLKKTMFLGTSPQTPGIFRIGQIRRKEHAVRARRATFESGLVGARVASQQSPILQLAFAS